MIVTVRCVVMYAVVLKRNCVELGVLTVVLFVAKRLPLVDDWFITGMKMHFLDLFLSCMLIYWFNFVLKCFQIIPSGGIAWNEYGM